MYKESWGLKRICPCNKIMYYDLGRTELECPECGKAIEVSTLVRPRRGRKPGSTKNVTALSSEIPPKPQEKEDVLNIESIDIESNDETIEDDAVLIDDDNDTDSTNELGIKPTESEKEEF